MKFKCKYLKYLLLGTLTIGGIVPTISSCGKKTFLTNLQNISRNEYFSFADSLHNKKFVSDDLETYGTGWVSNPIFKLADVKFVKSNQDDPFLTTSLDTGSLFLSLQLTNVSVVNSYLKKHNNHATLDEMMNDSSSSDHPGQKLISSIEIGFYNPDNIQFEAALKGKLSSCEIHTKRDASGEKLIDFNLDNNFCFSPITLSLSQHHYIQDAGSTILEENNDEPYFDYQTYTFKTYPMSQNTIYLSAILEMNGIDLNEFTFYKDLGNVSEKVPAQYKLFNNNDITFNTSFNVFNLFKDWNSEGVDANVGETIFYQNTIKTSCSFSREMLSDLDYPNISKIEFANEREITSINASDSYKIFPSDLNFYNIFNELMPEYDKNIWLLSANLSNKAKLLLQPDDITCTGKIEHGSIWNDWTENYLLDEWSPQVIEKIQDSNQRNGTVLDYINVFQNWEYRYGGRDPIYGWMYIYRQKESFTLKFKYINAIGEREFPITNPNSNIKPLFEFYKTDIPYSK